MRFATTAGGQHTLAATAPGDRSGQLGHSQSSLGQSGHGASDRPSGRPSTSGQLNRGRSGHAPRGHAWHGRPHPGPATAGAAPATTRGRLQPTSIRKDTTMTTTRTATSVPAATPSSRLATGSAGRGCERNRLSGWVLARLVLLLAVQIVMITALMTGHPGTPADTTAGTTAPARVTHVAYTQPLAPNRVAALASRSGETMTCAGRSTTRDHGGASATGFNLNVVVGRGGQSGAGPLVVTCGQQGQLMILACSPLTGDADRAPALWDRPSDGGVGRAGWVPAGWDQPGWRTVWRRDWRGQGVADDQLDLLTQLDPDQLRALLGHRYPSNYQGPDYYGGGYGGGPVAGVSLGGMRISIGAPTSLHQLPLGPAEPYRNPYSDPYASLYASGAGVPWSSAGGGGASSSWNPGYGAGYGPSSLEGSGYLDDPDSPALVSSHHHDSAHDRDDDPDEDRGRDSARGGWGAPAGGQPLAVCRWIGQR